MTAGTEPGLRTRAASKVAVVSYSTEDDDDDDSNTDVEEVVVVIVVVVVVIVVAVTLLQLVEVSERTLRKHAALAGLTPVLLAAVSLLLVSSGGLATLVVPLVLVGLLLLLATTIASKLLFLSFTGMVFTLLMSNAPVDGDAALSDDEARMLLGFGTSDGERETIFSKLVGL